MRTAKPKCIILFNKIDASYTKSDGFLTLKPCKRLSANITI